ncbi:MAG: hypothetical protein KIT20_02350 [Alphaproteobacteria bacterium]|nr:hypothetical protein [Alphaproteobacteria bacterium]
MPALSLVRRMFRYLALGLGFVLIFVVGPIELMRLGEAEHSRSIAIGVERR